MWFSSKASASSDATSAKKYEDDEAAAAAVWSLWEQTNLFLALGDDESAESFGKVLDEAGSKL